MFTRQQIWLRGWTLDLKCLGAHGFPSCLGKYLLAFGHSICQCSESLFPGKVFMDSFCSKPRALYTLSIHSRWTREVREQRRSTCSVSIGLTPSTAAHGPVLQCHPCMCSQLCGPRYLLQTAKGGKAKRAYVQCRQMIFPA